ncbi:gliding motility lipoprotein GldH [Zunongwangia sp.]|uniref:gliding motility lipoprotein GldH n=1 Tax=Zunongwangia sp. TaxID=1965325 RepID=UPI003AA890E4
MRNNLVSVLAILSLIFWSCDSNRVYDSYKSLPNEWNKDSIVSFKVNKLDTTSTYNLFLNVRNNADYKYANLFLITEMQFPKGKVIIDTLEYKMANPDGSWLGDGFGDVKENKLWYKEGVRFTESGTYQISIRQAMRKNGSVEGIENLDGITDVGFRIEKNIQNK